MKVFLGKIFTGVLNFTSGQATKVQREFEDRCPGAKNNTSDICFCVQYTLKLTKGQT